jgi:hypothetical protein
MGQCMGLRIGAPGLVQNVQAIHTRKRNRHQIKLGKTINDLCLMLITSHVFICLCVRSSMLSL